MRENLIQKQYVLKDFFIKGVLLSDTMKNVIHRTDTFCLRLTLSLYHAYVSTFLSYMFQNKLILKPPWYYIFIKIINDPAITLEGSLL